MTPPTNELSIFEEDRRRGSAIMSSTPTPNDSLFLPKQHLRQLRVGAPGDCDKPRKCAQSRNAGGRQLNCVKAVR